VRLYRSKQDSKTTYYSSSDANSFVTLEIGHVPPGYFRRLGKQRAQDDLILRKRDRMRRWLCCTCQVEESHPSNDNGLMKSHSDHVDVGISDA
ncbi:hypothetical protein M8C21_008604, partial [Ambrosia artemisiifolia]